MEKTNQREHKGARGVDNVQSFYKSNCSPLWVADLIERIVAEVRMDCLVADVIVREQIDGRWCDAE